MKKETREQNPAIASEIAVERKRSLRTPSGASIPPAWKNVRVASDARSRLQAVGVDSKGRRVYLYSAEHMGHAAAAKFARLKAFGRAYPSLIRNISRDKQTSEEALVLYLITRTGFRVGSENETRAAVKAFGASTLQCPHVMVEGDRLAFNFTGKKGVQVSKAIKDRFLAQKIAGRCATSPGRKIFDTTDVSVRTYLHSLRRGSGFEVKDFRTYLGTLTALRKIKALPAPKSGSEFKRLRLRVGETVAKKLGNSPAIALKSYVSPEVFCEWESSSVPEQAPVGSLSAVKELLGCVHYDRQITEEEYMDPHLLEKSD